MTEDTFITGLSDVEDTNTYDVTDLEEQNDLIVLTNQISPDELVNDEDILNTESIIRASKETYYFNIWDVIKKGAINLVLPFINGMMLGFGEILAHEIGFKYNWQGARVVPASRHEKAVKSRYL